jgi:hypothetical protein
MKLLCTAAAILLLTSCQPPAAAPVFEGDPYGEPLTLTTLTPLTDLAAAPQRRVGDRVLVEGTVTDVCDNKGCWMDITSGDARIQVKVDDDVIVFPLSARGRTALVEGTVEERHLTAEQAFAEAAHRAEERSLPFDSTTVFRDTTVYRIRGIGALIRN